MRNVFKTMLCAMMMALLTVSAWAEDLLIAAAPKTGDRMNMPLMIGLVVVAAVAIVVLTIMMIRNNKKH